MLFLLTMRRFHNGEQLVLEESDTTGVLTLEDVKVNMSGVYHCRAYNEFGGVSSRKAELLVESEYCLRVLYG